MRKSTFGELKRPLTYMFLRMLINSTERISSVESREKPVGRPRSISMAKGSCSVMKAPSSLIPSATLMTRHDGFDLRTEPDDGLGGDDEEDVVG